MAPEVAVKRYRRLKFGAFPAKVIRNHGENESNKWSNFRKYSIHQGNGVTDRFYFIRIIAHCVIYSDIHLFRVRESRKMLAGKSRCRNQIVYLVSVEITLRIIGDGILYENVVMIPVTREAGTYA